MILAGRGYALDRPVTVSRYGGHSAAFDTPGCETSACWDQPIDTDRVRLQ